MSEKQIDENLRVRGWCFTCNNYTNDTILDVEKVAKTTTYLVYGKEIGTKNGTPHLQGFLYWKEAKSFKSMKKKMPEGTHLEQMYSTPENASMYCKKDKEFVEFGTCPLQGKRNDIINIKTKINEGGSMRDCIEIANSYQCLKTAELLFKYIEKKRDYKPYVCWIWGPTGSNKTKTAYELTTNPYRKSNITGKWWDGYDGHLEVIIDDVKDTSREFYSVLLELTDRYDCRVECKGTTRQFLANKIYITSLYNPLEMYSCFDNADELKRRIDEIICMPPHTN